MNLPVTIGVVLCLTLMVPGISTGRQFDPTDSDKRIHYYEQKISDHLRHYPAHALLGAAFLDKARETHDPIFLDKARRTLERSLEVQSSFTALQVMAALCNFAHRFEDALRWGRLAAQAFPADTAVTAILVEAYLGLGRESEAAELLPTEGTMPSDFHIAVAQGHWFVSQDRFNEAAGAFVKAASFARAQGAKELVVWAEVAAGGAHLDSGQIDRAKPHIDAASRLDPENAFLRVHQAELAEAEGQTEEALAIYEELLERSQDPAIHAMAFRLAQHVGSKSAAHHHFEAAESGFLRAIRAEEVYTLGALARLYAVAGVKLEEALALAQRNLHHKRDALAVKTLAQVQEVLAGSR